jgi:hypothetical protein
VGLDGALQKIERAGDAAGDGKVLARGRLGEAGQNQVIDEVKRFPVAVLVDQDDRLVVQAELAQVTISKVSSGFRSLRQNHEGVRKIDIRRLRACMDSTTLSSLRPSCPTSAACR